MISRFSNVPIFATQVFNQCVSYEKTEKQCIQDRACAEFIGLLQSS